MALRKERKNTAAKFMAWFVAIVMIASVFGIVLDYNSSGALKYGKQKFAQTQERQYVTTVNGQKLTFDYFPTELEFLPFDNSTPSLMNGAQILLVTFDPTNKTDQDMMFIDYIRFDMSNDLKDKVFFGVVNNDSRYPLPLIGCANASSYAPIIILQTTNSTGDMGVTLEGNCILVRGAQQGLIRAYDRLKYGYYGIITEETIAAGQAQAQAQAEKTANESKASNET